MTLAVVQHGNGHGTGNGAPMGSLTLGSTPTVGNLLIAFVGCNININSVTLANGWKAFAIAQTDGESAIEFGLYRYVQSGDTTALPSFSSAGNTWWGGTVYEISGVTGTWKTDCHSVNYVYSGSSKSSQTTLNMRTDVANALALVGFAQYNGNGTSTFSSGWTSDESTANSSNYGCYGCAHQAFATAGSTVNCTVTYPGSSGPCGIIQVILAPSAPTHYTIRQSKNRSGNGTPGSLNLDMDPVPGNLIVAFLNWSNGSTASPTVGTSWTDFDDAVSGSNKQMLLLRRYAQSGDTLALPALVTSGSTFWSVTIHEICGTTGAWATDFVAVDHGRQASGSTMTSTSEGFGANSFVIASFSNYNGSGNLSFSSGDSVLPGDDFGNYGSWGSAQLFSLSGGTFSTICTMTSSSNPQAYIQLVLGTASSAPTSMQITQAGLEVWDLPAPAAQVSQVGLEVWDLPAPAAQFSQVGLEVWVFDQPAAQFTQVGLEVWRTTDNGSTVMVATQAGAEVWIGLSRKRRGIVIIMG